MINCIDKNKKVNINFKSLRKSPLDNHQPSKALKINRQPSMQNRQNLAVNFPIMVTSYLVVPDPHNGGTDFELRNIYRFHHIRHHCYKC